MPRRLWLSLGMLATGSALLVAAQLAGAAPERRGGILKVGTTGASVQVDPQLSYITTGWWLEYATAAKLYNYRPGGKLVPEVASRFVVANDGSHYTFFLRKGFRFSDGTRVTAENFKYAFDRVRNPSLQSPGAQFATNIGGVYARGMKLVVYPKTRDGDLLSTLALPFFQATSTKLPVNREVVGVRSMNGLPSAGPYAFTLNDVNRMTSLRRNPYWTRGPGRAAPRNLAGLDLYWNLNEQSAFQMVKANQLDEGPIPAAEVQNVANQYGVNRSRFWVEPTSCIGFIAFNNRSGLFKGNAAMRRAFNWALDRTDYIGPAGPFTRTPWTHLLPPGYPGSITNPRLQPYAPTARVEKARQIAAGHFRDGKITGYYRSSGTVGPAEVQIVQRDLINLGFDPANITMKGFAGGDIYDAMGKRGSDFDLGVSLGSCTDFVDASRTFPFPLLYGGGGAFFPDNPKYRNKIAAAMRLHGNARTRAIGKLDLEIMRNVAPLAVTNTYNDLSFFSNRVDPRSLSFHRVYQGWSIPSLALK